MPSINFPAAGVRLNPEEGVRYHSACMRYEVYESDQVGGIPVDPVRWLAIRLDGQGEAGRVIGRHRCRQAAERKCVRDAAALARLARRAAREQAERERRRKRRAKKSKRPRRVAVAK